MQPIVQMQGLSYKSGQSYLLRDINWEVYPGQHWIIFGLNGSGKTTLLSMVAGYRKHTYGTLKVFGEPYCAENIFSIRKKIGWVSSSYFDKTLNHESALNIVLSGLSGTLGLDGKILDHQVVLAKDLLKYFHLGEKIDYPFDILSKGERQCVLMARALLPKPKLLILDEPSTGLDILAKENMLQMVHELAANMDITILYITHYVNDIQDIFKNTMLLKQGRIHGMGKTESLFTSEVMSSFLDYPVSCAPDKMGYRIEAQVSSYICSILNKEVK